MTDPKKTFKRLPLERQKQIICAAIEEFAHNDFDSASLSKIISRLGIAKGSFYRYFSTKKDLYLYTIEYMRQVGFKSMGPIFIHPKADFFEMLSEMFMKTLQLEDEYPHSMQFSIMISNQKTKRILGPKLSEWKQQRNDNLLKLIQFYQAKNNIRADIDSEVLVYLLQHVLEAAREYFNEKHSKTLISLKDQTEIRNILSSFWSVFKSGLSINVSNK